MRSSVRATRNWTNLCISRTTDRFSMAVTNSTPPLVQHESVAAIGLISFVVILLIGLGAFTVLASYWFTREAEKVGLKHAAEASYPELERLHLAGIQQLNRYEALGNGIFRIPIHQAMKNLSEEFPENTPISEEMRP